MAFKSGSISLGSTRVIKGIIPLTGLFSVQLLSADLSANTTFNLQYSSDGTNWANAKEAGTDIADTLVQATVNFNSFSGVPGTRFRILFAGVTTGTVDYILNAL